MWVVDNKIFLNFQYNNRVRLSQRATFSETKSRARARAVLGDDSLHACEIVSLGFEAKRVSKVRQVGADISLHMHLKAGERVGLAKRLLIEQPQKESCDQICME